MAGLRQTIAIDIDLDLSFSFNANFPRAKLLNADLSKFKPGDFKREVAVDRPTAVLGGPPCQGFSVMGRRDRSDPRNRFLHTYFEYIAYFRPKFFLMENVPGLGEPSNRVHLDKALNHLPGRYNLLEPTILNAADFGAATSRPRLVVIGYDPEYVDRFEISDITAAMTKKRADVRAAISDLPKLNRTPEDGEWLPYPRRKKISPYAALLQRSAPRGLGSKGAREMRSRGMVSGCQITHHTAEVTGRFAKLPPGARDPISKYYKLSWNKLAYVLRAGTGADRGSFQAARPIHPDEPRVVTVREAARIQGFPDWFQFHPTKWHSHRMIGNSVSPLFAKSILKVILAKLERVQIPAAAE